MTTPTPDPLGRLAFEIFHAAIVEDRCAELLTCLFSGGSATVDDGELVLTSAYSIQHLVEESRGPTDAVTVVLSSATAEVLADINTNTWHTAAGAISSMVRGVVTGRVRVSEATGMVASRERHVETSDDDWVPESMGTLAIAYGSYMSEAKATVAEIHAAHPEDVHKELYADE